MKQYSAPKAEVVKTESVDIITTSGSIDLPEIPIYRRNGIDLPEIPVY